MRQLKKRLDRVINSDVTVLVTGESGTGKEVVARALHSRGPRRHRPFVAVNCSCIPPQLLESEFFGHAKGAFTDATRDHIGLLVQASSGTLFLDEIGDMPIDLQPKLLRALQERTVRPLGHSREVPFDVRVIAATSKGLEREVMARRFREDLYFRLNVLQVRVPPLRERGLDVLLFAQHCIHRAASSSRPIVGLTPGAARALLAHSWPGNVRELEHCVVSAIAHATTDYIRATDLPPELQASSSDADPGECALAALRRRARLHLGSAQIGRRQSRPGIAALGGRPKHAVPQAQAVRRRRRVATRASCAHRRARLTQRRVRLSSSRSSFRYRVARSIPSLRAACTLFPPTARSTTSMCRRSTSCSEVTSISSS